MNSTISVGYIVYCLRHNQELLHFGLDFCGWISIKNLHFYLSSVGRGAYIAELQLILSSIHSGAIEYDDSHESIRCRYGHTIEGVSPNYRAMLPPGRLFHFTEKRRVDAILCAGLNRMKRKYVHLFSEWDVGTDWGARTGRTEMLVILAAELHADGGWFSEAAPGVWLTSSVPAKYLSGN